jgi:NADPH2 dehydrogenase
MDSSTGMKMANPIPQFTYLIEQLTARYPRLSYIHFVEPRTTGGGVDVVPAANESNDFARQIWKKTGRPFLTSGGYTPEDALEHMRGVDGCGRERDVVVFGRRFIANVSSPFTPRLFPFLSLRFHVSLPPLPVFVAFSPIDL